MTLREGSEDRISSLSLSSSLLFPSHDYQTLLADILRQDFPSSLPPSLSWLFAGRLAILHGLL